MAYVGGYQGAPVSHLLDVMVQAKPYMDELGVHVEACANEASAAAMLGASIHYPLRGAVTWKSIVGTNVASDALSNLSSPGVKGGALIVVGEDYGEGASVIQERTHAYALKSSMCLLDPRPDLGVMVRMVEEGFRLSEDVQHAVHPGAAHPRLPCARQLRGQGQPARRAVSTRALMENPAGFDYMRLAHPPVTFRHEKLKGEERIPAARKYIVEHGLNELMPGKHEDLGIIVQGGLYNALIRSLQQLGLADAFGDSDIPLLVLNVTYPLVPEQVARLLRRQARGAGGRGRPARIHRAGDRHAAAPARHPDEAARQGPAARGGRVHAWRCWRRAFAVRSSYLPGPATEAAKRMARRQPRRREAVAAQLRQAAARPPAGLLHRLPRAAGVLGAQARAAGDRRRCTSRPTSAATPSAPSSPSRWAIRSWATA